MGRPSVSATLYELGWDVRGGIKLDWTWSREKEVNASLSCHSGGIVAALRFVCMRSISEPSCSMLWLRRENYFSSATRRRRWPRRRQPG